MTRKLIYRCNQQQNVLWLRAAVGLDQDTPLLVRLLIDTGASYTVLPMPILKRLGCNLNQPLGNKIKEILLLKTFNIHIIYV